MKTILAAIAIIGTLAACNSVRAENIFLDASTDQLRRFSWTAEPILPRAPIFYTADLFKQAVE